MKGRLDLRSGSGVELMRTVSWPVRAWLRTLARKVIWCGESWSMWRRVNQAPEMTMAWQMLARAWSVVDGEQRKKLFS